MAFVGYARVSSVGQSLDVQLDKLRHCDKVFQEKKSGTSDKRPELQACLEYVREGDGEFSAGKIGLDGRNLQAMLLDAYFSICFMKFK